MSDALKVDVSHAITSADAEISALTPLTGLAAAFVREQPHLLLSSAFGWLTPLRFAPLRDELTALGKRCGVYDLGWRGHIAVRGEDRVRWLNGMVTNTVQQLAEGEGNYSFFLNAQGRIQGDAFIFRDTSQILIETAGDEVEKLLGHLDHFIIMDDVALEDLRERIGAIGLAGPEAEAVLRRAGLPAPPSSRPDNFRFEHAVWQGEPVTVTRADTDPLPVFEIWASPSLLPQLWAKLVQVEAQPVGIDAVETVRVLAGTPVYGTDITGHDLPQETRQTRALNFNKGCYLGQEIVERIRSRGNVHRTLAQFRLEAPPQRLPADLRSGETLVGKLTSAVTVPEQTGQVTYALGTIRQEALMGKEPLTYNQGRAVPLDHPPILNI